MVEHGRARFKGTRLLHDVWRGQAGAVIRIGLSVISATAILAIAMTVLGIIEAGGGWLRDEHIALIIGTAAAAWCGTLGAIWWSYGRFQAVLKATFLILAIWAILIPLMVVVESAMQRGEEFIIAALVLLGVSLSITAVTLVIYRRTGDDAGHAIVHMTVDCPSCGYSLIGLAACRCPECGVEYTIESLVTQMSGGRVRVASHELIEEGDSDEATLDDLALPEPESA